MAQHDIEKMISEALGEDEAETNQYPSAPRTPLPHRQHILNQYAKLWEEVEAHQPDPSADVELPAAPASTPQPTRKARLASVVKAAVARIKL